MKKRLLSILPVLVGAMVFYLAQPVHHASELHAQTQQADETNQSLPAMQGNSTGTPANSNLKTSDGNGGTTLCSTLPEAKGGVILGRIIPCLIYTIERSTETFSEKFIELMKPTFYAFLSVVIVFFGVKVLQGEREIGPQTFVLVLKIAFVIGMLQIIPHEVVPKAYGVMSDGVTIVTNAFGPDTNQITCDVNSYGDANTPLIWKQMDCVLGKLYGFATGSGNSGPNGTKPVNMLLASSAFGLLTGFFFGGTLGVAVFFALIGVLWSVAMLVLRTALAFMNGYLIVCIMLIISPLFLPLVLFKITGEYFDRWWKAIFGGLLLPTIVVGYSMFALLMYDKALFSQDSIVNSLFEDQVIKDALKQPKKPCDMVVTNDPKSKGKGGTADDNQLADIAKNPFVQTIGQPLLTASSDACGIFKTPNLDTSKINWAASSHFNANANLPNDNDPKKIMTRMFLDCVKLMLICYLIAQGVEGVQNIVASLTGSNASRSALEAKSAQEAKVETAFATLKQRMSGAFSRRNDDGSVTNLKGADFLRSAPGAVSEAGRDAIKTLRDKK